MTVLFNKAFLPALCFTLSVLVHILFFYAWLISGTYNFSAPVTHTQWVQVDLSQPAAPESSSDETESINEAHEVEQDAEPDTTPTVEKEKDVPEKPAPVVADTEKPRPIPDGSKAAAAADKPQQQAGTVPRLPSEKFLAAPYEKLTYLISLFGIPVGTAELEAKNIHYEVWLTLRVRSNTAISSLYPVDDLVETRHISGQFIMTKIRQKEGSFASDEGFTINLRKKRVSWFDNLGGRSQTVTVPTDEVFDTLSGIYFLRNRQLQVGKTETLHIFDSESYAEVPVEILRKETVRLPNLTSVNSIVVKPLQKSAGLFRRTGDILIWMTDDAFKVPVKIVTTVALGSVTVELISAETAPLDKSIIPGN
ncbi:MAG: hypothetical protein A2076_17135 [Geobacteraceae bacterium GWC2_53_11]|nr:MAG: hypothetical protein A2076_17135 [Geobacteraceae bacterium GWC2_53_11]